MLKDLHAKNLFLAYYGGIVILAAFYLWPLAMLSKPEVALCAAGIFNFALRQQRKIGTTHSIAYLSGDGRKRTLSTNKLDI